VATACSREAEGACGLKPLDPIEWEATLPIRPSSPAWRAVIKAIYGSPLDGSESAQFRQLAGGIEPNPDGYCEVEAVVGRRGGKSETIARVAVFEACFGGHEIALAPGQKGLIPIISPLREQSQEILNYAKGLAALPSVKRFVTNAVQNEITFRNGVVVRVMTADALNVSGPTVVCAILDEAAKLPGEEAASPDGEIINSLRPALAPVVGAPPRRFIMITSAYLQSGVAYTTDRECYGKQGPMLVVRGATEQFNPNIDKAWLKRERERIGATVYLREYGTPETGPVWQAAITDGWFGDVVDRSIDTGVTFRRRVPGFNYVLAIDQAFKADRFAACVAHGLIRPGLPPLLVMDYIRAWRAEGAAMSVDQRVKDIARLCRFYGTNVVFCDQFGFEPLRSIFHRAGLTLIERPWTATSKAPKFRQIRDAMTDGRVKLLDNPELASEFHSIQGELLRSGGERIEAKRGHDDRVSAAVLALTEAALRPSSGVPTNRAQQREWDELSVCSIQRDSI
jgi:hypothetical protein